MHKTINIEVGANSGSHTKNLAGENVDMLYAFEPNPELYFNLTQAYKGNDKICILPFAVSDKDSMDWFNISRVGDKGTSSLYNYHENLGNTPAGNHEVFTTPWDYRILVPVIRIETFLNTFANTDYVKINYIHIDAQGSDLNVLKGIGKYWDVLKEGVCEATLDIPLYQDANNQQDDILEFLGNKNVKTELLRPHQNRTEIDIRFWID